MKLVIIKYNAGNIRSVDVALRRLGVEAVLTDDHDTIRSADRLIFPGVGEASTTMEYLRARKLDRVIRDLTQPVLGICLGLQLMCSFSEEGKTPCLGIFEERVVRFAPGKKVPHMGWNQVSGLRGPLFRDSRDGEYMYFVHSYYAPVGPDTTAVTGYTEDFSAALGKDNFHATQFHPEKSGTAGEAILKNFLAL
jgi:glutamine amidotransferase